MDNTEYQRAYIIYITFTWYIAFNEAIFYLILFDLLIIISTELSIGDRNAIYTYISHSKIQKYVLLLRYLPLLGPAVADNIHTLISYEPELTTGSDRGRVFDRGLSTLWGGGRMWWSRWLFFWLHIVPALCKEAGVVDVIRRLYSEWFYDFRFVTAFVAELFFFLAYKEKGLWIVDTHALAIVHTHVQSFALPRFWKFWNT